MKLWDTEQDKRSSVASRVERMAFGVLISASIIVMLASLFYAI